MNFEQVVNAIIVIMTQRNFYIEKITNLKQNIKKKIKLTKKSYKSMGSSDALLQTGVAVYGIAM